MPSRAPFVDLRSDTVTRPCAAMRAAMADAVVGDHVLGDDPTAAELESLAAEILGKERALFFPSGIMANQAAILLHSRPGTEVLLDEEAHILHYEEGAAAALGGVQLRTFPWAPDTPLPERLAGAMMPPSPYLPERSLVCLENTHNRGGGHVVPVEEISEVERICRAAGFPIHLDGARLPNAAAALGVPMRAWADRADTVMLSLSKGLGAPIGSVLAGTEGLMERAVRIRRRLGGGMRQVGIIAAAGIFALRHNSERLAEDHRRAAALAGAVASLPGLSAPTPRTNIVMIDIDPPRGNAAEIAAKLGDRGVGVSPFGSHRLRAVTHLDFDDEGLDRAIEAFHAIARR